jgi:hypothetical protein
VTSKPPVGATQSALLAPAAQMAVQARDGANLAAAPMPAAMIQGAAAFDAASGALRAATLSAGAAQDQIPTFASLAATIGFTPFTDHARREGDPEFFAESSALFLSDPTAPDRMKRMNRSIFLWFQAGMPMDPSWRPPP